MPRRAAFAILMHVIRVFDGAEGGGHWTADDLGLAGRPKKAVAGGERLYEVLRIPREMNMMSPEPYMLRLKCECAQLEDCLNRQHTGTLRRLS